MPPPYSYIPIADRSSSSMQQFTTRRDESMFTSSPLHRLKSDTWSGNVGRSTLRWDVCFAFVSTRWTCSSTRQSLGISRRAALVVTGAQPLPRPAANDVELPPPQLLAKSRATARTSFACFESASKDLPSSTVESRTARLSEERFTEFRHVLTSFEHRSTDRTCVLVFEAKTNVTFTTPSVSPGSVPSSRSMTTDCTDAMGAEKMTVLVFPKVISTMSLRSFGFGVVY